MKKTLHIAAASLNQTPLDWEGNFLRCREAVKTAQSMGVDLLCLPELCVSGYGCEDMFMAEWVVSKSREYLLKLSEVSKDIRVLVGLPFHFRGSTYNAAAVIGDARVFGIVPKQFLANDGIHYEARWFTPWKSNSSEMLEIEGQKVPFGALLFSINSISFGIEICEDAWVKERPGARYINCGASLICNLSASHFSLLKSRKRIETTLSFSDTSPDTYYLYSNLLGNEAGRAIYDGSSFIAQGSRLLSRSPRFSFREMEIISEVIEETPALVRENSDINSVDLQLKKSVPCTVTPSGNRVAAFESSKFLKEEEFTRAVSLGMFDYMRKSKSRGFVISLSGGADSAACACLSRISFLLAVETLGVERVKEVFPEEYLTLVYLKTQNNSEATLHAAKSVADGLGGKFAVFELDTLVSGYTEKVSEFENKSLNWDEHSIPLQNIQARSRGPLVWFLANLRGALLLSTSNRSEAAVGYTTMDGDTCGGLSPIGGIDKAFLLSWLRWLSAKENHSFGDFSFLEEVNSLSPSAELKPLSDKQTDEEELMPYIVLDVIERGFVGEKKSPDQLIDMLLERKLAESGEQAKHWVHKFLRLWQQNQWKRERYAPSFHLDDQSLDPKTWCRYPILSGTLL